jgi:hypothetical protein
MKGEGTEEMYLFLGDFLVSYAIHHMKSGTLTGFCENRQSIFTFSISMGY